MAVSFSQRDVADQTGTLITLRYQSGDANDRTNTSTLNAAFFLTQSTPPQLKVLAIEADPLLRRRALYPLAVQRAVHAAIELRPEAFRGANGEIMGDLIGTIVSESTLKLRKFISPDTSLRQSDAGFPIAVTSLRSLIGTPSNPPIISNLSRFAREGNLYSDLRDGLFHDELDAYQKITKAFRPTLLDPASTDDRALRQSLFEMNKGESNLAYARRFLHPVVREALGQGATYATLDHLGREARLPINSEELSGSLMRLGRNPTPDESMAILLVENALIRAENAPHDPKARFDAYLEVARQFEQPGLRDLFGLPPRSVSAAPEIEPPVNRYREIGQSLSPIAVLTDRDKVESVGQALVDRNLKSGGRTAYVLIDAANPDDIRIAIEETHPMSVVYLSDNPAAQGLLVEALSNIAQSHGLPFRTNVAPTPATFLGPIGIPGAAPSAPPPRSTSLAL